MPALLYKSFSPQQGEKVSGDGHWSLVTGHWSLVNRQSSTVDHRGFTLLELIIVISLVSLILGLSTVFLAGTLSSSSLSATVREMVTTIRHARALAQSTGMSQSVIIDLDARAYSIEGHTEKEVPGDVNIMVVDGLNGREIGEGTYRMVFHPSGSFEGGRIVLWNDRRRVNIDLDPITGARITE